MALVAAGMDGRLRSEPTRRVTERWRPLAAAALWALVAALAAVPRLGDLGPGVTADEPLWFQRASAFGAALGRGDWAATEVAEHPGVTTAWLGALGMGLGRASALDGEPMSAHSPGHWDA